MMLCVCVDHCQLQLSRWTLVQSMNAKQLDGDMTHLIGFSTPAVYHYTPT